MRIVLAALTAVAVAAGCAGTGEANAGSASAVGLSGFACRIDVRGGGVVIEEGLVLTAAHVVAGVEDGLEVVTLGEVRRSGTVVSFDPDRDLALVAVDDLPAPPAELAVVDAEAAGSILAIGPDAAAKDHAFRVLRRLTATGGDIYGDGDVARKVLEVAADVEPGASGAPAFIEDGRLAGIVVSESRTKGVVYVVAAGEIQRFLDAAHDQGTVGAGPCR